MTGYIIGIDQSTQSTKAFLYGENGEIVAKAALPHHQLVNAQGWIAHDLDEIWGNLLKVVAQLVHTPGVDPREIRAVGLTNQRESAAAWSRSTGKPLGHSVVWQDARAKDLCEQLAAEHPAEAKRVPAITGLPLSPYFTAAKFAWLLNNRPEVANAAAQQDLCLGTMDSWLIYQLTGGRIFATEPSNACRTALLDLQTQAWDPALCAFFGVPEAALPKVAASDADFGKTDFAGLLPQPVPVTGVIADSQGALFGQGGLHAGDVKATYGTGSSVMANVGGEIVRSTAGLVSSIGWRQGKRTTYVLEGNINYTGALITWLKDGLHLINSPDETGPLAAQANPADQTVVVPAFTGLGAPYWQDDAQAAILNMTPTTKRPELVKAALDAIAFQIEDVLASLREDVPALAKRLRVDGGSTHNDYLMQAQSDLSDVVVEVPQNEDMSAFGAALLAGERRGFFQPDQHYIAYRQYQPKLAPRSRKQAQARWTQAVATIIRHAED